jgi:CRISPR-associated endonuclease/helicase Cas3
MPDEVLTIKEVAALLKLAEKTVYAMAQAGEIPAFKIRGQWRIRRTELDQWIDAQPRGGDGVAVVNDSREDSFRAFFELATNGFGPYGWQLQVAVDGLPDVLPVPTGLGKTEVALAWAWRLLVDKKPEPLHLVVCLPMRSLVTQTVQRLKTYFDALKAKKPEIDVAVHQLMGGAIDDEWVGHIDQPWVLVGTQDQLLSRALNRGYSMSRFEWPVHFGLLNNDCRWLIDEVQLMGPGLWTTSQLDWMRRKRFESLKPCPTTWMSATVGTSFLGLFRPVEKPDQP